MSSGEIPVKFWQGVLKITGNPQETITQPSHTAPPSPRRGQGYQMAVARKTMAGWCRRQGHRCPIERDGVTSWRETSWRETSWKETSWRETSWRETSWRETSWRGILEGHGETSWRETSWTEINLRMQGQGQG